MSRVARRWLMLAVALIAVVAAVLIITLGGGKSHPKRQATAAGGRAQSTAKAASSYLGIGLTTVRRRLRNGETLEEIADSTPGHSSQALVGAIVAERAAQLRKHGATPAQTTAALHRLRTRLRVQLRRKRRSGALVRSASRYLGIEEGALREQLRSGKTLAQVAEAHGHSRPELIEGMLRARTAAIEMLHEHGRITSADEKRAITLLRARVARAVDAKNL
jgi:hypothetical protein